MRLIETAGEIDARVGQRETVAASQAVGTRPLQDRDIALRYRLDRHEAHRVDLARCAKQHAAPVSRPSLRRMRGPCRIALREVE